MPVCAKMMSLWVRKVLIMAKAHIYVGALLGVAAVSVALVAGVSLVTIRQTGDWASLSTLTRHFFQCILLP